MIEWKVSIRDEFHIYSQQESLIVLNPGFVACEKNPRRRQ
jgi:hypothetical protein